MIRTFDITNPNDETNLRELIEQDYGLKKVYESARKYEFLRIKRIAINAGPHYTDEAMKAARKAEVEYAKNHGIDLNTIRQSVIHMAAAHIGSRDSRLDLEQDEMVNVYLKKGGMSLDEFINKDENN